MQKEQWLLKVTHKYSDSHEGEQLDHSHIEDSNSTALFMATLLDIAAGINSSINLKGLKVRIVLYGNPSHSCGASLAIWDHTVLPASRHK